MTVSRLSQEFFIHSGKCFHSQLLFLIENSSRPTSWQSGTLWIAIGPDLCKYTIMNKTQMTNTLQELQDFMFDTMFPADMCVDWYCDRFNVSATDEVIDFVLDAHDAFHGN